MRKIYICIISVFLVSCAAGPKDIYLQTGEKGVQVSCSSNDIQHCYNEAGKICQSKGYNIYKKAKEDGYIQLTITCRD